MCQLFMDRLYGILLDRSYVHLRMSGPECPINRCYISGSRRRVCVCFSRCNGEALPVCLQELVICQ
ncbi:hypothetical protein Hanom_Chr09g00849681 [Helianthus anomalus]